MEDDKHPLMSQIDKIERNRVTSAISHVLYIWVCPNGLRRKRISILFIILILTLMICTLVGANMYSILVILPDVIEEDVFRVPNDNTNKLIDRISNLKRYDMQLMINDLLIFDSITSSVSETPAHQSSTFDPEQSDPIYLLPAYNISLNVESQNNTAYYVRPNSTMNPGEEGNYYLFDEDIPYCKLISQFFYEYFTNTQPLDMERLSIYEGFQKSGSLM